MTDWKKLISFRKFDKTAIIGLILLITSFVMGALLRNSAYITDGSLRRFPACDTYIRGFCIPTAYFSIPLGMFGWLVINVTSFLVSAVLFVLGVVLVRK
jgi:uncharacterized membrane-anchored protein YitT (DUF2179 family)